MNSVEHPKHLPKYTLNVLKHKPIVIGGYIITEQATPEAQ